MLRPTRRVLESGTSSRLYAVITSPTTTRTVVCGRGSGPQSSRIRVLPRRAKFSAKTTNPLLRVRNAACLPAADVMSRSHRHYDVISAPPLGWESDPFKLTARNGYLYARGVADDKGPVLAIACAAADLLRARKLGVDLLFLVEGEEETGSDGFVDTVLKYKVLGVTVVFAPRVLIYLHIGSHRRSGCDTSQVRSLQGA